MKKIFSLTSLVVIGLGLTMGGCAHHAARSDAQGSYAVVATKADVTQKKAGHHQHKHHKKAKKHAKKQQANTSHETTMSQETKQDKVETN